MKEMQLLSEYDKLIEAHMSSIYLLVEDRQLINISEEYSLNKEKSNVDIGFNLFSIISDFYYRENFHSDILQVILDPGGKHKEGDKYLKLFLLFLKRLGANINLSDYSNAVISREKGNMDLGYIDLLIVGKDKNKAIIIENKINNAIDQDRQLPRYLAYVNSMGLHCDAIIYLTLNRKKFPDTYKWTDSEIGEIKKLIKIVKCYDETDLDLLNGWLYKAEKQSSHIDAMLILRQYGALIKHLGGTVMNKQIMSKFYDEMMKGENYKTALSFKSMMDDLILYRVLNLIEKFEHNKKTLINIKNYQNWCAFFSFVNVDKDLIQFAIWVLPEMYQIAVKNFSEDKLDLNRRTKTILEKLDVMDDFNEFEWGYRRDYKFPEQQQELFDYINTLDNKLTVFLESRKMGKD